VHNGGGGRTCAGTCLCYNWLRSRRGQKSGHPSGGGNTRIRCNQLRSGRGNKGRHPSVEVGAPNLTRRYPLYTDALEYFESSTPIGPCGSLFIFCGPPRLTALGSQLSENEIIRLQLSRSIWGYQIAIPFAATASASLPELS
jgi:hypothetical protein